MRIWSISLIKSDLKWCIHLNISLLFNYNNLVSVTAGWPRSPRGHMKPSSKVDFAWFVAFSEHRIFRVFKVHSNCDFWGWLQHPFWLCLVLALLVIHFQLFKLLCLAKDHWRGFSTRNAHMQLRLLGECHCWWTKESPKAHVAKFYGRLRLISSVLRAPNFPCV